MDNANEKGGMVVVTEEMKTAGEEVFWEQMGPWYPMDVMPSKELAELIFRAMLSVCLQEGCPKNEQ